FQPNGGYHVVPPLITGTFMPPKPNLVFNTAPTAFETDHDAFNVQLSPIKPEQDLSHTTIPSAPIIEDWVSDSEKESETKAPLFVPSFAQSFEHVKSPRDTVQPIETTIRAATPTPSKSHIRRHITCSPSPKTSNLPPRVAAAQAPVVSAAQVSDGVPKIMVTRPRLSHLIVTKSKSHIRRHITRSPSPKTSNSPPRVTAAQAPVVSAAQGMQEKRNGPTPHPQRTDPAPEGGVVPPPRNKRDEEFTEEDNRNELTDIQAINILSQGLSRRIFNILNQNETGREIWVNLELLMKGSGQTLERRKEGLFDEFECFRANVNELIQDYFVCFHKLVNDMKVTQLDIPTHQLNTKFANNLPSYW
nr:hypothetical protein [Tanacetum cinerariifolium]